MESQSNKKKYLLLWGIIIVVVALFLGWHYMNQNASNSQNTTENQATTTTTTSTTGQNTAPGASTSIQNGTQYGIVQPQPQKVSTPAPSLDRPFPDTSKLDASVVATTKANMTVSIANLRKDMTSFADWVDLGFERKTLGDYVGAAEDWEYVSLLFPQNIISFGNLGDLYANFLHDNAKAETDYQIAIKNAPTTIDFYRNLYWVYVSEHKNAQAVAVLQDGISKNPNIYDLYILLARYYRDAGNTAQAKVYYNQAISIAQKQGNASVAQSLTAEENAL